MVALSRVAPAFLLLAVLAVSGCTAGSDVSGLVKSLPEVQQYLKENPNADVRAALWPATAVEQDIASIREQCGAPVAPAALFKVDIKDAGLDVTLWLDATTREPVCVIKRGSTSPSPTPTPGPTTPEYTPPPLAQSGDWFPEGQTRGVEAGGLYYEVQVVTAPPGVLAVVQVNGQRKPVSSGEASRFGLNEYHPLEGIDVELLELGLDADGRRAARLAFTPYDDRARPGTPQAPEYTPPPLAQSGDWFPEGQTRGVYAASLYYEVVVARVWPGSRATVQVNGMQQEVASGRTARFPVSQYMPLEGVDVEVRNVSAAVDDRSGATLLFRPYDERAKPWVRVSPDATNRSNGSNQSARGNTTQPVTVG